MKLECDFVGTRDYSSIYACSHAIDYLSRWRSSTGQSVAAFNKERVIREAKMLSEAWGTELRQGEDTISGMVMVELPHDLHVADRPGTPGGGLRDLLRDTYSIETAIGSFAEGNFIRLSHAVYNRPEDYAALRDAILELSEA